MGDRNFNAKLGSLAVICVISTSFIYFFSDIASLLEILPLPIDMVASLLRWMSLSSGIGNFFACILYIAIGLSPLLYLLIKYSFDYKSANIEIHNHSANHFKVNLLKINSQFKTFDTMLIVLAGVLLYTLYAFINPAIFSSLIPELFVVDNSMLPIVKIFITSVVYSLIIGYVIIKFTESFKYKDLWTQAERIMKVCTYLYVAYICLVLPFSLFMSLETKSITNVDGMVTVFNYVLDLLPIICFVTIIQSGILLVNILKEDRHDAKAADIAKLLASRSRITVIVSVGCNITKNVIQLALLKHLSNSNFLLDIPFLPLILAFVGLLVAEHLKESSKIYADNQMII
ncbi:MAG: hypothetical protein ACK5MV_10195 [Aminipila sp.]